MRCPACDAADLRFGRGGMAAACPGCARIFGPAPLLAAAQAKLDRKRALLASRGERNKGEAAPDAPPVTEGQP